MFRLLGPAGTTQEAQLPSGTQTEDIMDELNRELWLLSAGGTRVMSRGEFIILKASGADVVVVGKERGGNVGGGGSDPAGGQEGGAEDGEEEVRVRMPMPKDWTHQHLLTFAFFGKLAAKEYRCPDLEPGEGGGNGPANKKTPKKQRAEDLGEADDDRTDGNTTDSTTSPTSDLSGRGIRLMTAAGKTLSRGRKRAAVSKDNLSQANHGHKRQMLEMLGKIQDDPNSRRLVDLVDTIAQTGKEEAAHNTAHTTRQHEINALKGEIDIYRDIGDMEMLKDARARLLDLYRKPVVVGIPTAPVPVGGYDGNLRQELDGGNSVQDRDGGGNSGQELDGGGNSGQELDGGGNSGQELDGGGNSGQELDGGGNSGQELDGGGHSGQELDGGGSGGEESGGGGDGKEFVGVGGGDGEEFFGVGGVNNSDSEEEAVVVVD